MKNLHSSKQFQCKPLNVKELHSCAVQDATYHITHCTGTNIWGIRITEIDSRMLTKQTYFTMGSGFLKMFQYIKKTLYMPTYRKVIHVFYFNF